jgi:hypothetical protein
MTTTKEQQLLSDAMDTTERACGQHATLRALTDLNVMLTFWEAAGASREDMSLMATCFLTGWTACYVGKQP